MDCGGGDGFSFVGVGGLGGVGFFVVRAGGAGVCAESACGSHGWFVFAFWLVFLLLGVRSWARVLGGFFRRRRRWGCASVHIESPPCCKDI